MLRSWLLQQYRVALFNAWMAFGNCAWRLRNRFLRLEGKYFGGIEYAEWEEIPADAPSSCPTCGCPMESRT